MDTLTFIPWWAGRLGLDCGNHEAEEYTVLILQDETVWPDSGGFLLFQAMTQTKPELQNM